MRNIDPWEKSHARLGMQNIQGPIFEPNFRSYVMKKVGIVTKYSLCDINSSTEKYKNKMPRTKCVDEMD